MSAADPWDAVRRYLARNPHRGLSVVTLVDMTTAMLSNNGGIVAYSANEAMTGLRNGKWDCWR